MYAQIIGCDFGKALDKVYHKPLQQKLFFYGIRGIVREVPTNVLFKQMT